MSGKYTKALLLALTAAALAGPTAAVAQPVYGPGDVPAGSHVQAFSTGSAASHYTPEALRAMGARMKAQADSFARSTGEVTTGSAASYYTPQALRAMGARMQAQADYYARSTGSIRQAGVILQQMGDHWAADAAFARARAQESQGSTATESAPVGDRWGSDAFQRSAAAGSAPVGDRWGSDAFQRGTSVTATSNGGSSDVLRYVLVALGILVAAIAAFFGYSQLRGGGSRPRVALP